MQTVEYNAQTGEVTVIDWTPEQIAEWQARADIEVAAHVRSERNRLLASCDWTQLPDAPTDQTAWSAYRQSLRDVTDQVGFPHEIEWPIPPT